MMAERRYIRHVLSEEADSIVEAQTEKMNQFGFSNKDFFSKRNRVANEEVVKISFKKIHRFVDIKTRKTKSGEVRTKKAYPIYNRIIFGHIPNIVRRLSFGFTDDVVEQFKKLED